MKEILLVIILVPRSVYHVTIEAKNTKLGAKFNISNTSSQK